MKKLMIGLLLIVGSATSIANDQLQDEIICKKATNPEEIDNDLIVILRSHPVAWKKVVSVYENGYLGKQLLAEFDVPLQPGISHYRGGLPRVKLIYEAENLRLSIIAYEKKDFPLTGDGDLLLKLPDHELINTILVCQKNE